MISFIDIIPPIEEEIFDDDKQRRVFTKFPLLPYSANDKWTSFKLLKTLHNFKHMSPTFGGIIEDLKTYALKGKVQIVVSEDPVFDTGETREASVAEKNAFIKTLNEHFVWKCGNVKDLALLLSETWDTVGMMAVEVITQQILGVNKITVKYHHPAEWMFVDNDNHGTEVALSKKWDENYLVKNPPFILPVFPLEYTYKDGTTRTFFYKKNGAFLYGRPGDLSALNSKYSEYKLIQYVTKKNKKLWMPDLIIETEDSEHGGLVDEDDAIEAGYGSAIDRLEDKFTNEGDDPLSMLVTTRPHGAKAMFVHEINGLKNAEQVEKFFDICERQIIKANNWSKLLLYLEGASGFSNAVFMDTFAIKSVTKIFERQSLLKSFIGGIVNYGFDKLSIKNTLNPSFSSPLQKMLNDYLERNTGNTPVDSNKGSGRKNPTDM
jgi:hypothetical protein